MDWERLYRNFIYFNGARFFLWRYHFHYDGAVRYVTFFSTGALLVNAEPHFVQVGLSVELEFIY